MTSNTTTNETTETRCSGGVRVIDHGGGKIEIRTPMGSGVFSSPEVTIRAHGGAIVHAAEWSTGSGLALSITGRVLDEGEFASPLVEGRNFRVR